MIALEFDPDKLVGDALVRASRIVHVLRAKAIGARIEEMGVQAFGINVALPVICVITASVYTVTPNEAANECCKRIVEVQG